MSVNLFNNALHCTCCKDCTKRKLGCHASCIDYQRYLKELEIKRKEMDKKKNFVFIANKGYFQRKYA